MKIAMLAVAATGFLHLKGPDGVHLYEKGEPVGIDLFGPGSRESAQVEERSSARAVKRMTDNDNKMTLAPIDDRRREAAEDLVTLTAGFRHIEYDGPDGQPLVGAELFLAVYSDPKMGWINVQADKFQRDWGKFKPGSAGN